MSLRIAVQMNSIPEHRIPLDSTVALMIEAKRRKHEVYRYAPECMSLWGDMLSADVERVESCSMDHVSVGVLESIDLSSCDVVLMRQDPPFDMSYLSGTYLLERIHPATLVVNNPSQVRNVPEKLFVTEFQDLIPPTLITRSIGEIKKFREEFNDIVMKPLYAGAGYGVVLVRREDENFSSLTEIFFAASSEPWVVQKYCPEVRLGDKRVILVDGEIAGAVNRVPIHGEFRSNFACGGQGSATLLTRRELDICAHIGPILRDRGLLFVGIDIVGEFLTEINVTSPTGIRPIDQFCGIDVASMVWDAIEARC